MAELLRMPEVAANTTTATLADWLVAENHPYSSTDALAVIETDKAAVDLTAESDGVVLRHLALAGTEVQVGEPIAVIGQPGEPVDDIEAVIASLLIPTEPEEASDASDPGAAEPDLSQPPAVPDLPPPPAVPERLFASPLARRLAKNAGIATEAIVGTGPNGRIVRKDVEQALAERDRTAAAATVAEAPTLLAAPPNMPATAPPDTATSLAAPPNTATPATAPPDTATTAAGSGAVFTDTPHSRMRRAIAKRLTESKRDIPHFYLRGGARVDELLALRAQVNSMAGVKVSLNDLIVKAAARAHQVVPATNVIWLDDATRSFSSVDLGIAVATEGGLVTPVLRGVEAMSLTKVAEATRDFADRARLGKLYQHELEGGSSTVTNLGMYSTSEFAAIINPPQSSILAVGQARQEPLVSSEGTLEVGTVLRLTLSVDHRVVDGATAAQWMRVLVETLESPLSILL